jgi:hypothetical protein
MGKYLKLFETSNDYETFKNSDDWVTPNVSYILTISEGSQQLNYHKYEPSYVRKVGDIAYWDGGSVKTTSLSDWSTSLGTPIGVVVIPEGFAPDGKARIVSLKYAGTNGSPSVTSVDMKWGPDVDTSLTNYNRVPTTDNSGSTSTESYYYGQIPSDVFTGNQSFVDPEAYYDDTYSSNIPYSPSPYFGDGPNPEYYKTISGYNNAFSDFNGLSNTQTLVGLGSDYVAANAAWKYTDGASNLQWYLPGMGELGYILPRSILINESVTAVGGVSYDNLFSWSSTEKSYYEVWFLDSSPYNYCETPNWYKYITHCVRPFATI